MRLLVATLTVVGALLISAAFAWAGAKADLVAETQESHLLGAQVTYDTWSYTVESHVNEELRVRTNKDRRLSLFMGLIKLGGSIRLIGHTSIIPNKDKERLKNFFPANVGDSISIKIEDERGHFDIWDVDLEVVSEEKVRVGSWLLDAVKVIEKGAIRDWHRYEHTYLYNQELGIVLKGHEKWIRGRTGDNSFVISGIFFAGDPPALAMVEDARSTAEEEEARQQAEADHLENERLAAELAALKKKDETRKPAEAEAERIRKEEEARKLAEAERIQKEKEAQKLAKAERKRTEEERRLAEQKMIVAQEAGKLIPEIEAFAKTSPRQIDFLLLLELFHKAKPVTEGEWSEDLRDDYLALRKLVINDPEFIAFQEAAKARQAEERRIRTVALRTAVIRAAAFLKHFVVENFSSPSAPLALSVIGSLEEALSSEDPETLQAAAASFSSFIDRESLQVQLSHWESEFGDSIVAEADEEAPTKQVAGALEFQGIPADTASQTASDVPLETLDAPYVAIKNANVRKLPTTKSARVATLSKGSEVTALGKVKGENWYLVARDGKELGYVFGSLMAEAETVVPLAPVAKNPDAVAVVIGNKSYVGAIPEVSFAHNDADAVKRYLINTLGYREGNVIDVRDTSKGELEAIFGNEKSYRGRLFNYIRANESDVTVFYSGHGVPDTKSRRGYLLPVDADPDIIDITGYPLDVMLENLSKMPARSMSIFLDACFSGDSPKGMIIRATSGISVTAKIPQTDAKMVVITASQGDQYASWDEDAEHGLFTKHLLEALNGTADTERYGNGDGEITVGEVKSYLDHEMTYQARRRFNREQVASVSGDLDSVLVTYLSGLTN